MAMLVYEGVTTEVANEATLGRHRENPVVIRDGGASRKHSRIFLADGGWWIEDLGSANGTRLNGQKVAGRMQLHSGDAIRIGEAEVVFHCTELENAPRKLRLDPQSLEGRDVAGYHIDRLISRGASGFLYHARQVSLQREVALKVFARKVVEADPQFAEHFRELVGKAGGMRNDGFVQMHETGSDDGLVWYSMELVDGDTVEALLAREGRFAPALALLVCERLALAMVEAHKAGIVHRDLGPRTVMLTAEGKIKILDLGIATMLGQGRDRTRAEAAWYAAPECVTKDEPRPADDAYAIGCLLFHILAGVPPYSGANADEVFKAHRSAEIPSLRRYLPALPASADEVMQGLLTKNRDWRHADMAEIAASLRGVREGLGQAAVSAQGQAERMGARAAAVRRRRSNHSGLALTAAIILALLVGGAFFIPDIFGHGGEQARPDPVAGSVKQPPALVRPDPGVARTGVADPFAAQVQAIRPRLKMASGAWVQTDAELAQLGDEVMRKAPDSPSASQLRILRDQFAADADAWYQAEVAKLPTGADAAAVAARISGLSRLRDQVAASCRADVDARYQVELAVLVQRLNEAKRNARRAIEAGRPQELPAIAAAIAPAFANTPFDGLSRQFTILCAEAAQVAKDWNRDWKTTASAFDRVRGDRAVVAAAALLVAGDLERARKVLLSDPKLNEGALLSRRESIMGGLAAVLEFEEPFDLNYIEVAMGDPTLSKGALVGKAGDATSMACSVRIGGGDWQAEVALTLASASAEAVLSCPGGKDLPLLIRLAEAEAVVRGVGNELKVPVTVAGAHKVRLSCRGGDLLVVLDGRTLATGRSGVPAGSQLHIELAGSDWRLESLHVIGGK